MKHTNVIYEQVSESLYKTPTRALASLYLLSSLLAMTHSSWRFFMIICRFIVKRYAPPVSSHAFNFQRLQQHWAEVLIAYQTLANSSPLLDQADAMFIHSVFEGAGAALWTSPGYAHLRNHLRAAVSSVNNPNSSVLHMHLQSASAPGDSSEME